MEFDEVYTKMHQRFTANSLENVARLYCSIWKEPPWNEDFWTTEKVISDIQTEMGKKYARMFLAMGIRKRYMSEISDDIAGRKPYPSREERTLLVGFTWGYEVSLGDLREISGSNTLDQIFSPQKRVFYIDELGVRVSARNQGIGTKLSLALIDWAQNIDCDIVVLRTDDEAMSARAVYAKIGFQEMNEWRDALYVKRSYWVRKLD